MFPMTEAHPVRHMSVRFFVDDMFVSRITPDLSISKKIEITRFRTIPTLDLALPDIVDPKAWQQKLLDLPPRPRTIDLMPPLDTPYDALDIRKELPIPKKLLGKNDVIRSSGTIDLKNGKNIRGLRHL